MPGKGEALDVMADVAAHMNYDDDDEEGEKPSAGKTEGAEAAGTEEEKKAEDSATINEPESEETKSPAEKEVTVGDGAA